jgi:hypothetical protein
VSDENWTPEDLNRLEAAIRSYDRVAAERLCAKLVAHLAHRAEAFPEKEARTILGLLRRKRLFDLMERVADALIGAGSRAAVIRRQLAQSLIDQAKLAQAEMVLAALLAEPGISAAEIAEARGLLGRVHKQRYMNAPSPAQKPFLARSIAEYRWVYESAPAVHVWHGINAVALKLRAERDGFPDLAPDFDARDAAGRILATFEQKPEGGVPYWDLATAAEGCIALGRHDDALEWLKSYLVAPGVDAFELGSFLRQMQEVWGIDERDPRCPLVLALKTALLEREGGALSVGQGELQLISRAAHDATTGERLERVFGPTGPQKVVWLRNGLSLAVAVGRVEDLDETTAGTCFLVRAGEFFPKLSRIPPSELLVLTNSHVLGTKSAKSVRPADARVRFDELQPRGPFEVKEIVWESSSGELDAAFARIYPQPACDVVLKLAPVDPPEPSEPPRQMLVIGHPRGGGLSMSLSDNVQVGWMPPRLHYRTPTEPGSSGSPVFDGGWRLIALHRAARERIPRQDAPAKYYEANEGVWIHAIRRVTAETGMVIALAGRRIDKAGTEPPSFPLGRVAAVRAELQRRFGGDLAAIALVASAACGADLVALDVAGEPELGIQRRVVLPFSRRTFRDTSVVDRPGEWGAAYDDVISEVDARGGLVELQGSPEAGNAVYLDANEAIFDEALRLAGGQPENVVAVVVWEGRRKGPEDATAGFADRARARGIRFEEVRSV